MNYKFHVGDYVETIDGLIGYVTKLQPISEGLYVFSVKYVKYKDYIGCKEYNLYCHELQCFFNRIGAYDFTKKEKKKIEPIFRDGINEDMSLGGSLCMLKDKINELVDAVNLLMDKEEDR